MAQMIRVHERTVAARTITRIRETLGLPPLQRAKRRRAPRQLTLFKKPSAGDSVQVDIKVVTLAGTKAYQYTGANYGPIGNINASSHQLRSSPCGSRSS